MSGSSSHDLVVWLNDSFDDVNGISSSTVSSSHFTVHLGDGSAKGDISILFVHVDDTLSGLVLEHDTVVSNAVGASLEDLAHRDDFSLSSTHLVLSLHLIPELRSSEDGVLGEHSDSVAGWLWVGFAGRFSAHDPVLVYVLMHGGNSDTFGHL